MERRKEGQGNKRGEGYGANGSAIRGGDSWGADRLLKAGNQAVMRQMAGAQGADTGIPGQLKERVEQRSGFSLDDVKVHYQSTDPAKVGALAFTQGNQVFLGPGQERHLPHELGHVVQQKQGRVKPTGVVGGRPLNDDPSLEREADSYRQL